MTGALPSQNLPIRDSDSIPKRSEIKARVPRNIVQDRPSISDDRKSCYKNLSELTARVQKLVLNDWNITLSESRVRLCKFKVPFIIPRLDIQIDDSLGFTLIVFGWFLPEDHSIYMNTRRSIRNITVSNLIKEIEKLSICTGHPENAFSGNSLRHVLPVEIDPFDQTESSSPFPCKEYLRANNCEILVEGSESNCKLCIERVCYQEMTTRRKRARETVPAKPKAPVSLTSPQRIKLTLQAQRLQCKELQAEIKEMKLEVEQRSIPVTQDLSHDLLSIISESSHKMTPFIKLFWEQQKKNASCSAQGRRYHPTIIRWCISIASKSASAYDELRDTFKDTTIILPSRRVLRYYSNAIAPKTGFNPGVINELRHTTRGIPVVKDLSSFFLTK